MVWFAAAIPAVLAAAQAAGQAKKGLAPGEVPEGQFNQSGRTSDKYLQPPKSGGLFSSLATSGLAGAQRGTGTEPGTDVSVSSGLDPNAIAKNFNKPPQLGGEGAVVHGPSVDENVTAYENEINKAMDNPEVTPPPVASSGNGFADIMSKIAMGAKVAQSMGGRSGPGQLINFAGAANSGFGGAPVSQGFIQQQRQQSPSFAQMAQRLRR